MNQRSKPSPKAQQQRTTVIYAVGTFLALSLVAVVAWTLTRDEQPATPAAAQQQAAMPAEQAAPAADPGVQTFERISVADFKAGFDAGKFTVIDVRTIDAYGASHIPGSLHIPVSRIQGEIPYLPKGKPIVTYCTCPAEESSGEAAMILAHGGVPALALQGGLDAWVAAGYPTASGLQ